MITWQSPTAHRSKGGLYGLTGQLYAQPWWATGQLYAQRGWLPHGHSSQLRHFNPNTNRNNKPNANLIIDHMEPQVNSMLNQMKSQVNSRNNYMELQVNSMPNNMESQVNSIHNHM